MWVNEVVIINLRGALLISLTQQATATERLRNAVTIMRSQQIARRNHY